MIVRCMIINNCFDTIFEIFDTIFSTFLNDFNFWNAEERKRKTLTWRLSGGDKGGKEEGVRR